MQILIADDQMLFAENLKIVLETLATDMKVVGIAENGKKAVELARTLHPDLILMDVFMPEMDGVEATRRILTENPTQKILVLTSIQDENSARRALKFGAAGYLLKDMRSNKLITMLRAVSEGVVILAETTAQSVFCGEESEDDTDKYIQQYQETYQMLNNREIDVLKLLTKGLSNQAIANRLFLSESTVRNYISSIYSKFKTNNRMEVMEHGRKILMLFSSD